MSHFEEITVKNYLQKKLFTLPSIVQGPVNMMKEMKQRKLRNSTFEKIFIEFY